MTVSLSTNTPLSFTDWVKYQNALLPENIQLEYYQYVQDWYVNNTKAKNLSQTDKKQQFIQLLKDLSFLFASEETNDLFLKNLDYNNDEELIYAIPFFAKKLKQIAIVLQRKRESVKQTKLKYNLVGSNEGLEKLLYEYILKGFTNTENSLTQVPAYPLISYFPDLSTVKDSFYIELEELHDTQSYFDSDPLIPIKDYLDISNISDTFPFNSLSPNTINELLSARYYQKVAETPLSNLFNHYLLSIPTLSTVALSSEAYNTIYNQIYASKKYLGEPIYGLTAVQLKDVNTPDLNFSINLTQGNNWFYWPSGNRVVDDSIFNNSYEPIAINDSNFIKSGASGGTDYTNSDLIFTDKNGIVEGAWLQGPRKESYSGRMNVNIKGSDTRDFIFPFPGILLETKGSAFKDYLVSDENNSILNFLDQNNKNQILNQYYTFKNVTSSCEPIYINQTDLINSGAHASLFSIEADNLIKRNNFLQNSLIYSEKNDGKIEQAYAYKFQHTDLPVSIGVNNIHWPIHTYGSKDDSPITIKNDFCLPVVLSKTNPTITMAGAVAGLDFATSDVIYKMNGKSGQPIEAAWLGSTNISNLDTQYQSIPVYAISATKCSSPISGPVQPSLSFVAKSSEFVSFVWCDPDTPADQVFKHVEHLPTCPYGLTNPHDYYNDQDYQSINPIKSLNSWNNCNCKSVYYSPIGNAGDYVTDYNGMADYLFADPDGLGADFALNSWTDTRGLDVNNSPQFAFYKITDGDNEVGWGPGYWKNGSNNQFILKTGRRYTYYRSSLRIDSGSTNMAPYMVCNYPYKNIQGLYTSTEAYNLVILIDVSKSQQDTLEYVKTIVSSTVEKILNNGYNNVQISVITFGTYASRVSWLTRDYNTLKLFISQIQLEKSPDSYQTNIADAFLMADDILAHVYTSSGETVGYVPGFTDICSKLNYSIFEITNGVGQIFNNPNAVSNNAKAKILIFSDGYETINEGIGLYYADSFKFYDNIEVYGVGIGQLSNSNNLLQLASSKLSYYFDLQTYLNSGDGDIGSFVEYISLKLGNSISIKPTWYKAIRNANGNWSGTFDISDMIITPGDYLSYVHRSGVSYISPINATQNFSTTSISFTINIKLDGWDYINSFFSNNNVGENFGGKPFWGKVYNSPDKTNNFFKGTWSFGGQVRYFDDYVPYHQPEISSMILSGGDNILYTRKIDKEFSWQQDLTFNVSLSTMQWNKLLFKEDYSNLKDFLRVNQLDGIVEDSTTPSNLTLESYSTFKPAYYNYYARNPFSYNEKLFKLNRCLNSFVVFNSAVAIEPTLPSANLGNIHFPTVANISFPSQAVTDKQVGEYLLPEKLGTPTYRGKGFTAKPDFTKIESLKSLSAEFLFNDINKYGPRSRGLSKNDQISPSTITNFDNRWFVEPYSSGEKGGVLTHTLENLKFTPYQTNYELYRKNDYGIARQSDIFEFWTPAIPGTWNDKKNYPLDFKQQLPASQYAKRKEKLLTDVGSLKNWRTDTYGNQYGLYKKFTPANVDGLQMWFSSDYGVINTINKDPFGQDILSDDVVNTDVVKWMDRSGKNNNLFAKNGAYPQYTIVSTIYNQNNIAAIYFDRFNNLSNNVNLNNSEVSMFIVGSYVDSNNTFAYGSYQVLAGFTEYLTSKQVFNSENYVNYGGLIFSNRYGDFNFIFGNDQIGYKTTDNTLIYKINLNDYYGGTGGVDYYGNPSLNYPPKQKFYTFEAVFKAPYASTYINGDLFADNKGTFYPSETGNYFDTNLYSIGGFWVGSYNQGTLPAKCYICEIIYYNRAVLDSERKNIETYLNEKYGLY
jgi:hypothetical protein